MQASRARILVVDDKENMLLLVKKILAAHHDVTTVGTGAEALALLRIGPFDLVLTDVRMPDIDGFDLTRSIKEQHPTTEVVMMTGYASIEAAVEAIRLGAYDYIAKPFDPDDVMLVVARALERKSIRDQAPQHGAPAPSRPGDQPDLLQMSYKDAVNRAREQISRDYLVALLQTFGGNITRAAERAGMERESLHRLLKKYGLRADAFRESDAQSGTSSSSEPDDS